MEPEKPIPEGTPRLPHPLIGRDEMNLAEFPIALTADRANAGQKTLYFEDRRGRLTVTGSDAYGLPTAADADVIVALIYQTKTQNNFKDVKVNFTKYGLLQLLRWPDTGPYYKRLDDSLNRWGGVWLVYDKCWWNNRLKLYSDAKMHILESVELFDSDTRRKARLMGQGDLPLSYFVWNRTFIESCQADNLRQLDLDTYFSLDSAIAKRLYRFLGKRFYLQRDCTFDLHEIAFERVGLSRNYADAYKIKEKLHPAIEELEAIGFLRPLSREERYQRIDRGQWTIRLIQRSPAQVTIPAELPQQEPQPVEEPAAEPDAAILQTAPLVQALADRGVTRGTAVELVQRHLAGAIEAKIEVFDWLADKQDKRVAQSPAGYLVASIEKDYATPKGFISKAERQRREEVKQAKEREAAAERRRKQEQDARERAEREAIDAYWASLTPQQQAELDAASLAQADPETLALEEGPLKRLGQKIRRHESIRQLLRSRQNVPAEG